MTGRREFITLLGGATAAWPLMARAQKPEDTRRIGFLRAAPPPEHELDALLRALGEHGYVQGRNFVLVPQWGDGNVTRLSELAIALVNQGVDIIVTKGTLGVRAAVAVDRNHSDRNRLGRRSLHWRPHKKPVATWRKCDWLCQHGAR